VELILNRPGITTDLDNRNRYIYNLTATNGDTEFATLNDKKFNPPDILVLLQAIRPTNPSYPAGKAATRNAINNDLKFYGTNNTFTLAQGEHVIIVISSYVGLHTFHMHGHDFQVL
jgi:FtsP/CotA-like multicopper oxidase with cupredoxin domain